MEKIDKEKLWGDILSSIKVSVSKPTFGTWFKQTHLIKIKLVEDRYLVEIGCETSFTKATIETRYHALIQDALTKSLGKSCNIVFVISSANNTEDAFPTPLFPETTPKEEMSNALYKSKIRKQYTFENYAVSTTNQMAFAAAEAVSTNPGIAYNPLFIWGGVGVGKTHLMNAVGYSIIQTEDRKVLFCTGEDFMNDMVEGIRNKTTSAVRNKYRKLDALCIDDIQFIAGKVSIQEEFFHTFNTLVASGSQIILTSDRPPNEISKLEERLRSRFEAGLIVDIANPDFDLRCAITQIKAIEKDISIPNDLVQLISGNIHSAREIEGFIVKLSSEIKINKETLDLELIEKILNKRGNSDTITLTKANPQEIVTAVSQYYSIGKRQLLGASRTKVIARPRQVLMYLLRKELELPFQEIGRIIGGRDHTTVMYAVDKITHLTSSDVQTRADIRGIKNTF